MTNTAKMSLCVIGVVCLSGCSSIFGGKQASISEPAPVDVASIYHDYAVEQLETGRQLIARGAYANALQPLRKASADRESAPAAYNAMGVAYVKLGREDVAKRFFSLALILDPENPSIVANSKKFKTEFALKSEEGKLASGVQPEAGIAIAADNSQQPAVRVEDAPRTVTPAYGSALSVSVRGSALSRVSSHEVKVVGGNTKRSSEKRAAFAAQYPIRIKFRPSPSSSPASE